MRPYHELGHIALGTALRNLANIVSKDAEHTYRHFGFDIEPKWFPVFYVLASNGPDSVVNIAKTINHSHVSVSKIVKEMKNANIVASDKSRSDSRVTVISLTEKAKAMIPAMERQCEAVDAAMRRLAQESGIDLWQSVTTTHQHLQFRPISERVNEDVNPSEIQIVDYAPIYQDAYKQLNVDWISQHWTLEAPDYEALDNPQTYILNQSGMILIALYQNEPVGSCALIKMDSHTYELAKMAVSPKCQGRGIGLTLGNKTIERAKQIGAKRLYLESNSVLKPAVRLYEKLGFKHIDGTQSPYDRCDVQMELFL